MFKNLVKKTVEQILSEKYKAEKSVLPEGFHPADRIRNGIYHWLVLPFGSALVTCKLRTLGAGEFPLVSLVERVTQTREVPSFDNRAYLLNLQEEYCRKALVCPTFEEFEKIVLGEDGSVRRTRGECAKARELANQHQDNRTREAALREIEELELAAGYFLPPNFMMAVASWCECLDVTGVKDITPNGLYTAYILSQRYHNRASDNLPGAYLEHVRCEIDEAALEVYALRSQKPPKPKKGAKRG
jgi:hypothetical protein